MTHAHERARAHIYKHTETYRDRSFFTHATTNLCSCAQTHYITNTNAVAYSVCGSVYMCALAHIYTLPQSLRLSSRGLFCSWIMVKTILLRQNWLIKRALALRDTSQWDSTTKVQTTGRFTDLSGGLHDLSCYLCGRLV